MRKRRKHGHYVLECERRDTRMGPALRIQIERYDGAPMGWEELWGVFVQHYPGKWAVQAFPPPAALFNGANKYHLYVFDEAPVELDLGVTPRRTATASSSSR